MDADHPLTGVLFACRFTRRLAERAGIATGYLSQIENGERKGTVATLKKLAAALQVEIDDLTSAPEKKIAITLCLSPREKGCNEIPKARKFVVPAFAGTTSNGGATIR